MGGDLLVTSASADAAPPGAAAGKPEEGTEATRSLEDDELAAEIGVNAQEYLEECFYNEVSVLDRDKFDAIPEVVKTDLTILVRPRRSVCSSSAVLGESRPSSSHLADCRCRSRPGAPRQRKLQRRV